MLVNDRGDILYITGRTGKYLEPAAGKANWNIFVMSREGLRNELLEAFRKTTRNSDPYVIKNVKINNDGGTHYVDVAFHRMEFETMKGLVMIVFNDVPMVVKPDPENQKSVKTSSKGRVKELEIELKRSFEELESTKIKMQTTEEELKSMNEELQSANEELQSTNEELTTSKEEMQSMNEELQTVNTELQSKINDFIRAEDDMKNLLNSTEIATLFLDKEQNVRRFTDQVTKIFKLRKTDIGRPITDLVNDLRYNALEEDIQDVQRRLDSR